MRVSVFAVSAGATLAAVAIGVTWHHERDQADALRELTTEVTALRTQLAASSAPAAPVVSATPSATPNREERRPASAGGVVETADADPAKLRVPARTVTAPRAADGGRPGSPRQVAALASATDLVDAALRRGTISRNEMAILRARIDAAGRSEESDSLRARIADAIDQGAVVAERAPPVRQ